ncbi:hypothetical protein [Salarchaeum japonicum]|uniref:EMC6-like membrane protein n=1 Tax=Salarchaeum japonicum TaxID=555573 RepID=UPI003C7421B9
MSTETASRMDAHRRGVTVTTVACLAGVAAGVLSSVLATGATDTTGLGLAIVAMLVNLGVLRVVGVNVSEFGAKDHLYTGFMTFALWFITWGILLTESVSL